MRSDRCGQCTSTYGFHTQHEQSATGLLRALLKQALSPSEPIQDEIPRAFENSAGRGFVAIDSRFIVSPGARQVFISTEGIYCIGALNELPAKLRLEHRESLPQVVRRCPNTRLFLIRRLHMRQSTEPRFRNSSEFAIKS